MRLSPHLVKFLFVLVSFAVQFTDGMKVSKCHHEGDIQLECPRNYLVPDVPELIRSARVINGLYYNDSLCSFSPGTSCYRELQLFDCYDQPNCLVKNGWYSLEPHCSGNSYYTQVEYDCQPTYHMCDKTTVINNVFSGVIYSPHYPNSFRTDANDPCFMTIHLPKNHHVQITLDYFDMVQTKNCIGDYLEIQQYVETSSNLKRSSTYEFKGHESKKQRVRKQAGYRAQSKFKWHTLGTMCGQVESRFTVRATSDIVNIKFRPLSSSHHYLSDVNPQHKYGFKIYFEAVPPEAPRPDPVPIVPERTTLATGWRDVTRMSSSTSSPAMKQINRGPEDSNAKLFIVIAIATVSILLFLLAIAIIVLVLYKKRKSPQSNPKQSPKQPLSSIGGTESESIAKKAQQASVKAPPSKHPADIHLGSSSPKPSIKTPSPQPAVTATKPLVAAAAAAVKAKPTEPAGTEETRKMLADLPVLLQDLGTSKLLQKFKQQQAEKEAATASGSNSIASAAVGVAGTSGIEEDKEVEAKRPSNFEESGVYDGEGNEKNVLNSSANNKSPSKHLDTSILANNDNVLNQSSSSRKSSASRSSLKGKDSRDHKKWKKTDSEVLESSNLLVNHEQQQDTRVEIDEQTNLLKITHPHSDLANQISQDINTDGDNDELPSMGLCHTKLEIIEEDQQVKANVMKSTVSESPVHNNNANNLVTFSLPSFPSRQNNKPINGVTSGYGEDNDNSNSHRNNNTSHTHNKASLEGNPGHHSHRKPAFNPLHVILKDKNKYYTTEYI